MIKTWKVVVLAALTAASIAPPALAQSAWTTGTAADRARAGYASPYGSGFYAYAPGVGSRDSSGYGAFAMVPDAPPGSIDDPALTGGGSTGYNDTVRRDQW
jgi:hypothetical protein